MVKSIRLVPGSKLEILAGKYVTVKGHTRRRTTNSIITVTAIEQNAEGRTRIVWKSNGQKATALI